MEKLIRCPEGKAEYGYVIPNGVVTIGDGGFSGCTKIKNINISESVQSIEENAFYDCIGLENITIPSKVKSLKDNTFNGCNTLKSVELLGELVSVGRDVFYGCSNLEVVKIPSEVINTKNHTYYGESKLKSLESSDGTRVFIDYNGIKNCDSTETLLKNSGIGSKAKIVKDNQKTEISSLEVFKNSVTTSASVEMDNYITTNASVQMVNANLATAGISDTTDWKTDSDFNDDVVTIKGIQFSLIDRGSKIVRIDRAVGSIDSNLALPDKIVCNDEVYKVTGIQNYAFNGCSNLQSVQIANGITSIGYGAFSGCSGLMSIEIPSSVVRMDDNIFDACGKLAAINVAADNSNYESIEGVLFNKDGTKLIKYPSRKADATYTIPSSVKTIEAFSFTSSINLHSIQLTNGITSIGFSAFAGCSGLMSIEIPASVTSIGDNVFDRCKKLNSINTDTGNKDYESIDGVLFNKAGTKLIKYPKGKTDSSYTMPNTVQSIGENSFSSNYSLQSIKLSDGVTSIGYRAFIGCSGLLSIEIPSNVDHIGYYAFSDCYRISEYKVHSKDAKNMLLNTYSEIDPAKIIISGISDTTDWKTDSDFNDDVVTIKGIQFSLIDRGSKIVRIDRAVGSIDSNLALPDKIVCNDEVYKVTGIQNYAFNGCSNLQSVQIANGITSIGYGAFRGCSGLMSIEIPSSVVRMDDNIFDACGKLAAINVAADNSNYESIEGVLFNKDGTKLIKYPSRKADAAYTIPSSVKTIEAFSFTSSINLHSIQLTNGIASIGYSAFVGCSGLMSIEIPASVTSIGGSAFDSCKKLSSINTNTGNENYESIDGVLFDKAGTKLIKYPKGKTDSSYTMPSTVQSIGDNSFSSNYSLQIIKLADGITSIGDSAFSGCSGLLSMEIPSSVTTIWGSAFDNCYRISEYKVHSKDAKNMLLSSNSGIDPAKIIIENESSDNEGSSDKKSDHSSEKSSDSQQGTDKSQTNNNVNMSQYITNAITAISGGKIQGKETITTQNGNAAEVTTVSVNNSESAKIIASTVTDTISVKSDANQNVYVYVKELGEYKKVDSQVVGDKITFNAQSNSIYLVGSENAVGINTVNNGWNKVKDSWYIVNPDGSLKTGWYSEKGTWYNLATDGKMNTGWVKDTGGNYYLLANDGSMQTGWHHVDGNWYFMNSNGVMAKGWTKDIDGTYYYLNDNGTMATGWLKDSSGKWYYLKENGAMAHDEYVNGYYVDSDGQWTDN